MGEVVEIDGYRFHIERPVRCVVCDHRWVAVYPEYAGDDIKLECPECGEVKKQIMCTGLIMRKLLPVERTDGG